MHGHRIKIHQLFSKRGRRLIGALIGIILLCMGWAIVHKASAAPLDNRSMFISTSEASAEAYYIISFEYPPGGVVGALKFKFCTNPLISMPCTAPPGLDVSNATLAAQTGETGFGLTSQTANEVILSRTPTGVSGTYATYRLDNIINPSDENKTFYARITDHYNQDASDAPIDEGAVTASTAPQVTLTTEVPPILVFCVAAVIHDPQCIDTEGNYADVGELSHSRTATTTSQMLAFTNAQYGYAITASGQTMTSGVRSIPAPSNPTESLQGVSQFGVNLVANTSPAIGASPEGDGTNAIANANYAVANRFMYQNGDVLVSAAGASAARKFTTSYIVNVSSEQPPGIYSTTISYVCTAGF